MGHNSKVCPYRRLINMDDHDEGSDDTYQGEEEHLCPLEGVKNNTHIFSKDFNITKAKGISIQQPLENMEYNIKP